jgi:hypothetical protein
MSNNLAIGLPLKKDDMFSEKEHNVLKSHMLYLLKNKDFVFFDEVDRSKYSDGWEINHHVGRIEITLPYEIVPEDIKSILMEKGSAINPDSYIEYVEFVRYSNIFGLPRVDPHIDPPSKQQFMFNIQIDGNVDWDIVNYKEDGMPENFTLKNGECLVMDVCNDVHWRDPVALKDGQFLDMMFVHYYDNSVEPYPEEWYPHPPHWKKNFTHHVLYTRSLNSEYKELIPNNAGDLASKVKQNISENGIHRLLGLEPA